VELLPGALPQLLNLEAQGRMGGLLPGGLGSRPAGGAEAHLIQLLALHQLQQAGILVAACE
jgi:hypothetical protein